MFYILDNEKIVLFNENKQILVNTLTFMPQYQNNEIFETEKNIVEFDNVFYFEDDEQYLAKKEQAEKERIGNLFLTGADVERGIYQAKGMDFEDIIEYVENRQAELVSASEDNKSPKQDQLGIGTIDLKALKIELKANNFYRGNPYVSAIGALFGFSEEQLNLFFEFNDYKYLLSQEEPTEDQLTT